MELTCFHTNYNTKECTVSFGLPFVFDGPLINLPKTKDGKNVTVVGLTPYTVEKVISIPFEKSADADNICTNYYYNVPRMMEKLESLNSETVTC
jgi:hypothetical protein